MLVAATISTILGQAFIPRGTFPSLPAWAYSNAVCIELAALTPLPYVVLAMKIQPDSTFFGFRRKFWLIIIAAAYGSGLVIAGALAVLIFFFTWLR